MAYSREERYILEIADFDGYASRPPYKNLIIVGEEYMAHEVRELKEKGFKFAVYQTIRSQADLFRKPLAPGILEKILLRHPRIKESVKLGEFFSPAKLIHS